ncbi:MAG: hypothetical protein AAFZ38_08270 [Myxococcota bacterium]
MRGCFEACSRAERARRYPRSREAHAQELDVFHQDGTIESYAAGEDEPYRIQYPDGVVETYSASGESVFQSIGTQSSGGVVDPGDGGENRSCSSGDGAYDCYCDGGCKRWHNGCCCTPCSGDEL